jgi:hypothetical protein
VLEFSLFWPDYEDENEDEDDSSGRAPILDLPMLLTSSKLRESGCRGVRRLAGAN